MEILDTNVTILTVNEYVLDLKQVPMYNSFAWNDTDEQKPSSMFPT